MLPVLCEAQEGGMSRVQITAFAAVLAAIAFTWLANVAASVGDSLTSQLARKQANPPPVRTRVITSILDPDPTIVGAIPKRADGLRP
ncbi:hypothetical protein [Blastochloris tepida]|uniref:Uncharacterized protein n=1 Tax=Blastochloris tepida TaxID=2233851 RepID=A0A348G4F2_9HYPH|nr:hypothetical protein [Blastochloris tepida]BBF94435.1 hypothetical protein BLTE_31200 [Blastochloris tepida]